MHTVEPAVASRQETSSAAGMPRRASATPELQISVLSYVVNRGTLDLSWPKELMAYPGVF